MSATRHRAALLKRCSEARVHFARLDLALQKAKLAGDDTPAMHAEWRDALDALSAIVAKMEAEAGVVLHV